MLIDKVNVSDSQIIYTTTNINVSEIVLHHIMRSYQLPVFVTRINIKNESVYYRVL